MHPAVREAILVDAPVNWHLLVLQWPHVSISDPSRLAYTRTVQHGADDRQTITTISKYLAQNFPAIQSHVIRDICSKYGSHDFKISYKMDEMLELLARSPKSCMRWDHWRTGDWHPYQCYDPDFGWGLAVRIANDEVMARALVNTRTMSFVRSFGAINNDRGHSQNDSALNSWLQSQGFSFSDDWDGLKLAKIDHPHGGYTAPYLDGGTQNVTDRNGYFLISDDGEYTFNETDGSIENDEDRSYCEDCDDTINMNRGDHAWAGRNEDNLICQDCCDNHYVRAFGANGDEYLTHENNCSYINDQHYVDRFFSDNGIVYAIDIEEHMHEDDCIYLDNRSEYVSSDCSYAVYCEDSGTHEHKNDCVIDDDGNYTLIDNQSGEAAA